MRVKGALQIIFVFLIVGVILFLDNVVLLAPRNDAYLFEPELRWFNNLDDYIVLIDDNPEFSSPYGVAVDGNYYKPSLDYGVYYWKVKAWGRESEVRRFTVVPLVEMERYRDIIRNSGNVKLNLEMFKDGITGAAIADINEEVNISGYDIVIGRQG